MEKWANKVSVITGGSSGIGEAIAEQFLHHNITVINLDLNLSEKHSGNEKFIQRQCDLSNLESLKESFAWIKENFGVIHILVNCAGIYKLVNIIDTDQESIDFNDKIIDVNFRAVVHCAREGIRLMKESNDYGLIVNICSIIGHTVPFFGTSFGTYAPAKFAIRALSEVLRQELIMKGNEKIRVTNLTPGAVATPPVLLQDLDVMTGINDSKMLDPENIAEAVLFLLSIPHNVNVSEITVRPVGERM